MRKPVGLIAVMTLMLLVQPGAFAQPGGRAANVKVATAETRQLAPQTIVPGTVVSRSDARLAAEVTGRLVEVSDVGTYANKGDAIAKIEDTMLKLRRQELTAEVGRARARLEFLEGEENRYMKLAESNLAAATKLDETRSDRDMSRGDLQVALSRLAQVEDQLDRTRILAPFSGIVVERLMTPGERVDVGKNVVRMVDQQHLEVIARAPLDYYRFVRPGQDLELKIGKTVATGKVRTVVAVGSENTHQFEIRLDIEGNLFPVGQTLRVSVPTSEVREALVVPRDALVLRPEGIAIYIVDDEQKAQRVSVTTGIGTGEFIEVSGNLSHGDQVIVRGNERIRPGQAVAVMEG